MIRYSLLFLAITFLSFYSFKNWYLSLCGLVVLMAAIERHDMPRQMLGITGLNPWNILMLFVLVGCLLSARKEQLEWNLPNPTKTLLLIYLAVFIVGFLRLAADFGEIQQFYVLTIGVAPEFSSYVFDDLLNSIKYVVPGLLMFYGCNSRHRMLYGMAACLLASFLLGVQIIKWMPIGELANAELLSDRALRVLDRAIGYHRVDLAAMMASASWGFFVVRSLAPNKFNAWALTAAGAILILALALTGGRTGYGTWLLLAAVFTVLKWKRLIAVIPVVVILVLAVVPAVRERMLYGFVQGPDESGFVYEQDSVDLTKITSDRILIWPIIVDRIKAAPLIGYGRLGIILSGASMEMRDTHGANKELGHPHNAYLELLLDNGVFGAVPIFIFFFVVCRFSIRLFRNQRSKVLMASGGLALAFVAGQLIASIGAQSFYPRAGVVIMWCSIGIALRAYVVLQNIAPEPSPESIWEESETRNAIA